MTDRTVAEQRSPVWEHPRRRWMMALAILAGVICLLGAGAFLYDRYGQETTGEYDGVLVREQSWEVTV